MSGLPAPEPAAGPAAVPAAGPTTVPAAASTTAPPALPAAVRDRVLQLAAERLSALSEDEVPMAVRPFRRFTPRRRASAAAVPLATALERDPVFRQAVAQAVPEGLAQALREGQVPPAAPAEDVAAAAYLLRPDGWQAVVASVAEELAERERLAAGAATAEEVQRLTDQLEALRAQSRAQAARLTAERDAARAEAVTAVKRGRELGARAAAAERALARSERQAAAASGPGSAGAGSSAPERDETEDDRQDRTDAAVVRRLRTRLRTAEQALAAARSASRGDRREEQARLRVLLDAVVGAAGGLQRELALPPLDERPADAVAAAYGVGGPGAGAGTGVVAAQGRSDDDPQLLDALLGVRATHLLVDGYNVTKTGYGEQSLEVQRGRLLAGLGALAARTGVELTVVFDGAGLEGARPPVVSAPRGVRLLFSRPGESADDVLRALVRAEPPGRPLVVVSSDREVADDVRRDGARPVPSRGLLSLLERPR